jgi:hypothetical protein
MSTRHAPALLMVALLAAPVALAPAHAAAAHKVHKRLVRTIRRKGLASLPAVSGALASRHGRHKGRAAADVVGTPPTLLDIANGDPTAVFWQPGVVAAIAAGTPTPQQCSDFWAGQTDGASAGLGACRLAQDLAQAFGKVVQSDNSLCYMRNIPTPANLASGGFQVVSGDLPDGTVTRLFSVPADADRVVEVQVTGQDKDEHVFLRVANATANAAAGNLYAVDLWFCPTTPGATPNGYEHLTLDHDGHFVATEGHDDDGETNVSTVDGWVVGSGPGATWDTSRPRTVAVQNGSAQGNFKSAVQLSGDVISTWSWGVFTGDWRSFTATRFTATGPADVRLVSGAFSGAAGPQGTIGAAEYRDPTYVAAPALDLVSQVSAVDLATDPFFATPPAAPTIDTTGYACDAAADVVVAMDFSNPAIAAIRTECEGPRLDSIRLCDNNAAIQDALNNYATSCP